MGWLKSLLINFVDHFSDVSNLRSNLLFACKIQNEQGHCGVSDGRDELTGYISAETVIIGHDESAGRLGGQQASNRHHRH